MSVPRQAPGVSVPLGSECPIARLRRGRPCGVPSRRTLALAHPTRATARLGGRVWVVPATLSVPRRPRFRDLSYTHGGGTACYAGCPVASSTQDRGAGDSDMRAILIAVAALAAIAAAFFAGRTTAPGAAPMIAVAPVEPVAGAAAEPPPTIRAAAPSPGPRARLLAALDQSGEERDHAVRRAMTAWLAAEGADAIRSAREHPELGSMADRMVRLALYAYPEIFQDDPSLLGDDPDQERLIAMSVSSIAGFDPELARVLAVRHLADTQYGDAMLGGRAFRGTRAPAVARRCPDGIGGHP